MKKFQERRDEAKKRLRVAEHLLAVTHPLVEDPKLLLTVLKHLFNSLEAGMDSVIEYEYASKNLNAMPKSFEPRLQVFESEIAPKHGFDEAHVKSIRDLREILGLHENSQAEFPRDDKFVIADEEYDLETITADQMKKEVVKAKEFLKRVEEVVTENARIIG